MSSVLSKQEPIFCGQEYASDIMERSSILRRPLDKIQRRKAVNKKIFAYARVLHIYLSMTLFSLMLLFCVTGILLNHSDWLSKDYDDGAITKPLPDELRAQIREHHDDVLANPPLLDIQNVLKNNFNLEQPASISIDKDAAEIILDYKLPAGYATAIIDTQSARLQLEYRKGKAMSVMNDLHKGRDSGSAWSWVIDTTAALMLVFTITGMVILLQNKKHRWPALIFAVMGSITPLVFYLLMVPRLSGV